MKDSFSGYTLLGRQLLPLGSVLDNLFGYLSFFSACIFHFWSPEQLSVLVSYRAEWRQFLCLVDAQPNTPPKPNRIDPQTTMGLGPLFLGVPSYSSAFEVKHSRVAEQSPWLWLDPLVP